jgi:hypothetical protein
LALERVVKSWGQPAWERVLPLISEAREKRALPPGAAAPAIFAILGILEQMRARAEEMA